MAEISKPNMSTLWAQGGAILAPSDSKINQGWTAEIPPHQWENFAQNRQDRAIAYLYQRGIPEWDAETEYFLGKSITLYNNRLYMAVSNNVNKNPESSPNDWLDYTDAVGQTANPTGTVSAYAGSTAPEGFLFCRGQAVSRTTYSRLFAVIGETYGSGNGSTTFNVPDLRGEFIRGLDSGRGVDAGRTLGSSQANLTATHTHTASTAASGAHGHTNTVSTNGDHTHATSIHNSGEHTHFIANTTDEDSTGSLDSANGGAVQSADVQTKPAGIHTHGITVNNAGGHNHTVSITAAPDHTHTVTVNSTGGAETRPRNVALNYIIKT